MRADLELIEKIEQYLSGRLSETDKAAFEKQIANDPALQEEVSLQKDLMNGIERASIKSKIQAAKRKFTWQRNFRNWGLGGLSVILITAAVLYFTGKSNHAGIYQGKSLPEYNELGEKQWADADKNIAAQQFTLDAVKDTVIETKGGIVFAVAANSFINKNGKPVTGKIQLVVKEALDASTIMRAGLSTRSGDRLLETGGMFLIDARKDGEILNIDSKKGIYAEIPIDTVQPGMQLFSGKRKTDGTIDWIDPKTLEHDLVTVDLLSLNFYPPAYKKAIEGMEYNYDKEFTDSLYYSMARFFVQAPAIEHEYLSKPDIAIDTARSQPSTDLFLDSSATEYSDNPSKCAINPARIKAILASEFQNTFIATHEFEERLAAIHESSTPSLLDLYVSNLDKKLYVIDSIAASKLKGEARQRFLSFAARRDGGVKNELVQFGLLKKYYEEKSKAFSEAIIKTQNEYWGNQAQQDFEVAVKKGTFTRDSMNKVIQNFNAEFNINLKEAYRQLGYDTTIKPRGTNNTYKVEITSPGWYNVDKPVYESTANRTTLDYTDPQTGKKAVIKYLPISVEVQQWKEYDQLYIYLLPDKLSSFMRMNGEEGKYREKLNELMKYKLVCIGYKGEQAFYYSQDNVESKEYTGIRLAATIKEEMEQKLGALENKGQASDLLKENDYFRFSANDRKRQKHNEQLWELTEMILTHIAPCYMPAR